MMRTRYELTCPSETPCYRRIVLCFHVYLHCALLCDANPPRGQGRYFGRLRSRLTQLNQMLFMARRV